MKITNKYQKEKYLETNEIDANFNYWSKSLKLVLLSLYIDNHITFWPRTLEAALGIAFSSSSI